MTKRILKCPILRARRQTETHITQIIVSKLVITFAKDVGEAVKAVADSIDEVRYFT